jgi:hypothetical protein
VLLLGVFLQGKRSLFLGAVGAGARMKLVVNMTMGSMMGEQQWGVCNRTRALQLQQQ